MTEAFLMVPKLYEKKRKKKNHAALYLPLHVFLASQPSPLSPCQRAITAASRKRKLSPSFLPIFLSPPPLFGYFFLYCPSVRALKQRFFDLSFPLEMKRRQYGWFGSYIFACFSSLTPCFPHWPPSSSVSVCPVCVCAQ